MRDRIEPIHAHSFFTIDLNGSFNQVLIFDYLDRDEYYYSLLKDEERYLDEMGRLLASMNSLLKDEVIKINERRVEAEALTINLDFRGSANYPTISFYIEFRGDLIYGERNIYECIYDPGVAEYDYEAYWIFPRGSRVIDVESSTSFEVFGERFLVMWARRGDKYSGYEKIVFELPSPNRV